MSLRPLELGMAAACTCLAVALVYEYEAPISYRPPQVNLVPHAARNESGFYSPPSEASFSVIDERPIFIPTRKPVDAAQPPGGPGTATQALSPPNATLVGVIADGDNKLALIKVQGAVFASSFSLGTTLDGWQVAEIDSDRVILRSGAAQAVLTMYGTRADTAIQRSVGAIPNPPNRQLEPGSIPTASNTTGQP